MFEFSLALSFFSLCTWVYLFFTFPFRPSLIVVLYSFFSFSIRPISVSLCENFSPFYMYNAHTYDLGVLLTNICVFLYLIFYLITARSGRAIEGYDKIRLRRFANYLLFLTTGVLVLAVLIFGQAILPGMRATGLSKAAAGSQIFFAIVSTLVVPAIALRIFLFVDPKSSRQSRYLDVIAIVVLMSLSMLFYQRGPAIQGIVLGIFVSSSYLLRRKIYLLFRLLPLMILGVFVIVEGRAIVSQSVLWIYGGENLSASNSGQSRSLSCKIAMSGSQEHDQVWPTVFEFTRQMGHDYYKNLFAAIFRPFYSAEERDFIGLQTSVDALNLFNDSDTYLSKNFGFSITGWQYQYFSIGILVIPLAVLLGSLSALLENRMVNSSQLTVFGFLRIVIFFQLIGFVNGAFDERLKWLVFSVVLLLLVFILSRIKLIRTKSGGSVAAR